MNLRFTDAEILEKMRPHFVKAVCEREVVSTPAVLAIQLKRFYSVGGKGKRYQSKKITKSITYPDELTCQQLGSVRYRLLAVGGHRGGGLHPLWALHGHCSIWRKLVRV